MKWRQLGSFPSRETAYDICKYLKKLRGNIKYIIIPEVVIVGNKKLNRFAVYYYSIKIKFSDLLERVQ